ncbi:MFS general substrate transporter [Periconia macrospinosa]|uniref:MFS general substrate transporter n=1 Tax=Periconia macrospinosa TaxID=97972 RepID=A0A2V1DBM2_9PLEO|nr:MFS general substrate transporter [Periconia macrospinosa]
MTEPGVPNVEAVTPTVNRNYIIAAYILLWVVCFVDAIQQGAANALHPYVTSTFFQHSLLAYINVMPGIIGGILRLPLAKVLDIFGRPHGFALSVVFLVTGLSLMAECHSVHGFAAAQSFYWLGYNSLFYTIQVFIADTSALKNRGLLFAYINSPYIITAWLAGPVAKSFISTFDYNRGWRWCFGIFAIVMALFSIPLFCLFLHNYRKAAKAEVATPIRNDRTTFQSIRYYMIEFDALGLFLVSGGLVFLLVPLNLFSFQKTKWASPIMIGFLVCGLVMLSLFVCYERYLAPKTVLPYRLFMDRTVLGAVTLSMVLFVSLTLWDTYFSSFLQVVYGVSIVHATYIANIYTVGSCLFSIPVGIVIRMNGRFKWIALYFGVPVTVLGVVLMIHFRHPGQSIGFVILSQVLIAFAGGACVITEQVAAMSAVKHEYVALVLALEGMSSSIGGGIGSSIATAIWTSVFPARIAAHLPGPHQREVEFLYSSIEFQMKYPKGDELRDAVGLAYGDTMKVLCIASTAVLALGLVAVIMWRDIRVNNSLQKD